MKAQFIFILIGLALFSCRKSNDDNSQNSISGKFALMRLSSNLKSGSTDSVIFVLDTVKSSKSFYFIIGNSGQEDITNITLATDNSNIVVTPSKIALLPGSKSINSSTITQVVSLDVTHGIRINGVGYAELLNMGNNSFNLTIKGQTSDGNKAVSISFKANIQVFAKVMDISLTQGGQAIDMTKPNGTVLGGPGSVSIPWFYYLSKPGVVIKNTGNIAIGLSVIKADGSNDLLQKSTLRSNDTLTLKLPVIANNSSVAYIKLESQGTICNQQKIAIGNDGSGYISLINIGTYTPPYYPPVDSMKNFKIIGNK